MSGRIFISYRRDDCPDVTGRIDDFLVNRFGREHVFMDHSSIPLGVNFHQILTEEVARCDVLLVVIGPGWINAADQDGNRRLWEEGDYVHLEVLTALERNIPVIPLLVGGAQMVAGADLPERLKELSLRNATPVCPAPDFHADMERVQNAINDHLIASGKGTKRSRSPLNLLVTLALVIAILMLGLIIVNPLNLSSSSAPDDIIPGTQTSNTADSVPSSEQPMEEHQDDHESIANAGTSATTGHQRSNSEAVLSGSQEDLQELDDELTRYIEENKHLLDGDTQDE